MAALSARSFLLDGEAIVTNERGLAVFDLIRHQRHGDDAVLIAFDLIELDGDDLRRTPIEQRKCAKCSLETLQMPGRCLACSDPSSVPTMRNAVLARLPVASAEDKHKDWIELQSYRHQVTQPDTSSSQTKKFGISKEPPTSRGALRKWLNDQRDDDHELRPRPENSKPFGEKRRIRSNNRSGYDQGFLRNTLATEYGPRGASLYVECRQAAGAFAKSRNQISGNLLVQTKLSS